MGQGVVLEPEISVKPAATASSELNLLNYLEALTLRIGEEEREVGAVAVYAEPDPDLPGAYRVTAAADTGYEGIACVDDTARAALLALAVYERTRAPRAERLARLWLNFVLFMQYPDGQFANFIRNAAGTRNASGATSHRGGVWWSSRALRALGRGYRVLGDKHYLESYRACSLAPVPDGKINGLLALAEIELHSVVPPSDTIPNVETYCRRIVETTGNGAYLRDKPDDDFVHLWGYHQFEGLVRGSALCDRPEWLRPCRSTVRNLAEPDISARMWHAYPEDRKEGVTAYDVTPMLEGLEAMFDVTSSKRYRDLALRAAAWFYGRNDARTPMYDPATGRCRDGISDGEASKNYGAESSIEGGFAELARRRLMAE